MDALFLIAHKVRGEAAFDTAIQMLVEGYSEPWWIIPTSGHRAYPYWFVPLSETQLISDVPELPEDLEDHYTISNAELTDDDRIRGASLLEQLGFSPIKLNLRRI